MSLNIEIKKVDGFEIWTIPCPICHTGYMMYRVRPNGQQEYRLTCKDCYTLGSPDWFEMTMDTKYGKNVRKDFACGLTRQIPIC